MQNHKIRPACVKARCRALCFPCTERFPEPLEMHQLPLTQKADRIPHVVVIRQTQDIVVGGAGFLLRCKILCQIRDHIPGRLEKACGKGLPGSGNGVDPGGMIHKVGIKPGALDLLRGQIPGQLIHDRGDHFNVTEFFGAQRSIGNVPHRKFSSKSCVLWALGT